MNTDEALRINSKEEIPNKMKMAERTINRKIQIFFSRRGRRDKEMPWRTH
jgi:hypothetical protein